MRRLMLLPIFLLLPWAAKACDCAWAGRPCRALEETPIVFSARVIQVHPVRNEGFQYRLVTFRVLETFKGPARATVEVVTGEGGGDCGYPFQQGGEYLVYALPWRKAQWLYTGICSRTRKLSEAGEDLQYFQKKARPGVGKGIVGQIEKLRRDKKESTHTEWDGWLQGAAVVVSQGAQHWQTQTDERGQFSLWGLREGTYRVHARLPAGYVGGEIDTVEITPGMVCREVRILATPEWKPPRVVK